MHGLVSLLDAPHYKLVEELWAELETECGLRGIHVTPLPHFSWQIAEDYDWHALEIALADLAQSLPTFRVRTSGLALFSGVNPVIYIPVVRSAGLSQVHRQVWERLAPISSNPSPYYAPDAWLPHISLAYMDVNPQTLACAMQRLAFRTYNWEIEIDNLTLIYEPDGNIGQVRYKFLLEGAGAA